MLLARDLCFAFGPGTMVPGSINIQNGITKEHHAPFAQRVSHLWFAWRYGRSHSSWGSVVGGSGSESASGCAARIRHRPTGWARGIDSDLRGGRKAGSDRDDGSRSCDRSEQLADADGATIGTPY